MAGSMFFQLWLFVTYVVAAWTLTSCNHTGAVGYANSSAALFCPCVNRELLSFTFLMHYRDAITTAGAQLRAGVQQAARDRGLRLKEYIPVDFFRVSEVIGFLDSEIQAGTAGIVTTLCNDQLLPTLAAANDVGIPVYLIGGPEPDIYQGLQKREPATGPVHASIRHIGPDMAQVAESLASRLVAHGITHLECITIEVGDRSWHAHCDRLVAAFQAVGRFGMAHLRAGLAFDLADYALDMAVRLADVPDREVAVVVADYTLYRSLRTGLSLTEKADTMVVVYETSLDILADVRAGKNVLALDPSYYAQGYLGLSLAATERHTGQMVTSDIVMEVAMYGVVANTSEVTDAIMQREVCRTARHPVCGDPGVAPVTSTGCTCFNRSEIAYKVIGLIPTRVPFSYGLWQGMADAQRDLPGSTYRWDILAEVDFGAIIGQYAEVASSPAWRGAISLDGMFTDVAPIVGAMQGVPAAGKPLYLAFIHSSGATDAEVSGMLDFFGALAYVGTNAVASGMACTRAAVQAGLRHLVISNALPFFNWTWGLVRGMIAGFLGEEYEMPPGLWEGNVMDHGVERNETGIWQQFVAPGTNRTAQAINGISTIDFLDNLQRYVLGATPAPDVVGLPVYDEFMSPPTLSLLRKVAAEHPDRPPVQLVTQRCLFPEMAALLQRGMIEGEELLLGCVDEQPYLATYTTGLLAALAQHTGEHIVGEIRTERYIHASNLPPNFATRVACELSGNKEGYEKGQWGKFYPLCDARQGCVQGGTPGATVCSGRGACVFPLRPLGNETTRGSAGACECEPGRKGDFCERAGDGEAWLAGHPVRAGLLITLAVVGSLALFVCISLLAYFTWFHTQPLLGENVVEEFLRKRSPPRKGDAITAVITDIEGSTELWEWNPEVMKKALAIHHAVLRALLPKYYGYESNNEGDSFSLVFHNPLDALGWAMDVQRSLLFPLQCLLTSAAGASPGRRGGSHVQRSDLDITDWPPELVSFGAGKEERGGASGAFSYRGLRVRMGIHIGIAEDCTSQVNGRQHYHGEVMEVTKSISDCASVGGQVLMSMLAWQSLGLQPLSVLCQHLGLHEVGDKFPPLHLMQVLPDELGNRLPLKPPKSKQLSPSFFDAPCSEFYIKGVPPTDPVVIAFICVGHSKCLRRVSGYQQAIDMLVAFIQRLMPYYNAYECEEKEGNFLLAFSSPIMAARMVDTLQRKAMDLPWPEKLLEHEQAAEVIKPSNDANEDDEDNHVGDTIVFRGLRLQIGLCMGVPEDCHPHRATGRATYYGPLVNRAARIAATAAAGQTLCNGVMHDSIKELAPDLTFSEMGKFELKGVREPMHLYQISNAFLSARLFPRVLKLARPMLLTFQHSSEEANESVNDGLAFQRMLSICDNQMDVPYSSDQASPMFLSFAQQEFKSFDSLKVRQLQPELNSFGSLGPLGAMHSPGISFRDLDSQVRSEYADASHAELLAAIVRLRAELLATHAQAK